MNTTAAQPRPSYERDGITLYHADCLEVIPQLGEVHATIADPPYGLKENANRVASRTQLAATIDYGDFDWDYEPASREEIEATISTSEKTIVWGGNYFHLPPAKGWLVWDKLNSGDFADCELAWTNLKSSVRIFRHMWNGMIRQSERDTQRVHPTQKPVALMVWCLEKAKVAAGETVLDPFMGSGTTGIACIRTGRKFIGIEKDKRHFDTACERIDRELRQGKLL